MWETLKGRHGSAFGLEPVGKDEVSVVLSKSGNTMNFKINVLPDNFPEDTKSVLVRYDREKRRIGFFKCPIEQAFEGKALSRYGKISKLRYISMPKFISEFGFEKGRYAITRPKKDDSDMFFMIKADDRKQPKTDTSKE